MPVHAAKFVTFTSAIDLRAQSGYPNHAPQRVLLYNGTAGALNAVLVDIAGHSLTYPVEARTYLYVDASIASIAAATDDTLSAIFAYWWVDGATVLNA